jgi:hypothetical protein
MNEIPKVGFSKSLERADWPESRIARRDVSHEIASLKRESGKDMVAWGGARLFDDLGDQKPTLRQIQAIEAPGVTHIRYA